MRNRHLYLGIVAATLTLVLFAHSLAAAPGDPGAAPHKLTGQYVEFCSCERFCESALADGGRRAGCSFVAGLKIEAGQCGDVSLGGLLAAIVAPDAQTIDAKPGNGPVLYVDRAATPAQSEAIRAILSERFAARAGGPLGPPKSAAVHVVRTNEALTVTIEGAADLRARPFTGGFSRAVRLENLPGTTLPFPMLARGTGGQVADNSAGVHFDAEGKNVFYGKFDFGAPRLRK